MKKVLLGLALAASVMSVQADDNTVVITVGKGDVAGYDVQPLSLEFGLTQYKAQRFDVTGYAYLDYNGSGTETTPHYSISSSSFGTGIGLQMDLKVAPKVTVSPYVGVGAYSLTYKYRDSSGTRINDTELALGEQYGIRVGYEVTPEFDVLVGAEKVKAYFDNTVDTETVYLGVQYNF